MEPQPLKPYRQIPICECGEPLCPLPAEKLAFFDPHPYQAAGAPYGNVSPWYLRQSVVQALLRVADRLAILRPGWKFKLFDAYRPNAVQAYMVEHEVRLLAKADGFAPEDILPERHAAYLAKVLRIWAIPSEDPATPPLHSTGGAVDCTLQDENGALVDMGSPIDENSDRSSPDYFKSGPAAENRAFLNELMAEQGFTRHLDEWWHFGFGDQYSAWVQGQPHAIYGRADLV